ncbi:MAG: hypothetical protein HKN12_12345, partial [Gemmatimonadetes bacterium]|nr:hypothetical protein [Gemmatimonadota bacterium]
AQTERTAKGIDEAISVLDTLRSGWEEMPAEEARKGMESKRPTGLSLKG